MRLIRTKVFGVTQVEMAGIAKVSQATISRWESDLRDPSLPELSRIRAAAKRRRLKWDDAWLFEGVAA